MASHPGVGDPAPDFELEGTDGPFRLSDQRGKRVVLLFYPGDETPVCTKQFCSYRDRAEELENLDAVVVGISAGSLDSHNSFREHHGLTVPLLADTDREVAIAYSAAAKLVGTRRAVIVIDEDGIIRDRHVHTLGVTYQTVDDIRQMLEKLPAPAAG